MKFDVRPMITLTNGQDVTAAANVKFMHNDNEVNVLVSDTMVKDGMSLSGLRLGVKNSRFEFNYDVSNHSPSLRLNSHVNVRDKRVDLIYRNALKTNSSSLEAKLALDDNNTAGLIYNLTGYEKPDHKAVTLKYTYCQGDLEVSPMYNLGTETLSISGIYTVDAENKLEALYDMNTNMGTLMWTNSSGTGGGGDLKITARANLADTNSAKQMPTLLIEKTWSVDA